MSSHSTLNKIRLEGSLKLVEKCLKRINIKEIVSEKRLRKKVAESKEKQSS